VVGHAGCRGVIFVQGVVFHLGHVAMKS
jgi:hypothetical protein